jgi:hypothetical protein
MHGGSFHIERNITIAGAAIGLVIGLPYGPKGLALGVILGAISPLSLILLFSFGVAGLARIFGKETNKKSNPNESEDQTL